MRRMQTVSVEEDFMISAESLQQGGVDLTQFNVESTGDGWSASQGVFFDQAQLSMDNVDGFEPIIISVIPISKPLEYLGL